MKFNLLIQQLAVTGMAGTVILTAPALAQDSLPLPELSPNQTPTETPDQAPNQAPDQSPNPATPSQEESPQPSQQLPLPSLTPNQSSESSPLTIFENLRLAPNFSPDPAVVRGISGGTKAASELTGRSNTATGPCVGYVDQQPDHTIVLTQLFNYLRLQVQSSEDTSLVIRGPGGTWCNDNYSGKNPGIAGQWLSGTYQIWVGSPNQTTFSPYVIRVTQQKD
jgi:hypothetical protein